MKLYLFIDVTSLIKIVLFAIYIMSETLRCAKIRTARGIYWMQERYASDVWVILKPSSHGNIYVL